MVSLALAIGLCEALLWVIVPIPYDAWLVWEAEGHIRARLVPKQKVITSFGHHIPINKYGFRGPDHEYSKQPGTLRIAVFGGSAAFCYDNSSEEKTWPGALELKLKQRLNLPVEVINLGQDGYDSFNSKINYLCFGRAFSPDAIVVYHTWNDLKQFRGLAKTPYRAVSSVPNKPLWQRIARRTQLGRRARNFIWTVTKRRLENTYQKDTGTGSGLDRPIDPKALDWERRNFEDFAILSKSDGALPILVSQATLMHPESLDDPKLKSVMDEAPTMVGMTIPLIARTWQQVNLIIEDVARRNDAIFVDGYRAVPATTNNLMDHVHLWDPGCEALAEEIARVVVADPRFQSLVERVRRERTNPAPTP